MLKINKRENIYVRGNQEKSDGKKSQGWKLMFMLRGEIETYKCENNKFINIELCEL